MTNNISLGDNSLKNNKDGYQNSAIGSNSLKLNIKGINNTAVGWKSLSNALDSSNTAVGAFSGLNLKEGNRNILIGRDADVSSSNAINQIVIGNKVKGHGDNIMVLGSNETKSIEPEGKTDLGSKEYEFNNLYLDGSVYDDGNKIKLKELSTKKIKIVSENTWKSSESGSYIVLDNLEAKTYNYTLPTTEVGLEFTLYIGEIGNTAANLKFSGDNNDIFIGYQAKTYPPAGAPFGYVAALKSYMITAQVAKSFTYSSNPAIQTGDKVKFICLKKGVWNVESEIGLLASFSVNP